MMLEFTATINVTFDAHDDKEARLIAKACEQAVQDARSHYHGYIIYSAEADDVEQA